MITRPRGAVLEAGPDAILFALICGLAVDFRMNRSVVTFHYVLRDNAARIIDTSEGAEPVSYLEGAGHIIEGLEEQLQGTPPGAKRHIAVPAAKGYGLRDESQVQSVPRASLPVAGELRVGDRFKAGDDRFAPIVTVARIEGDLVCLDANHPLAGVDLVFDVEVLSVRPASPEEVEHGHVHGPDGQAPC